MKNLSQKEAGGIPTWVGILIIITLTLIVILLALGSKYPQLAPEKKVVSEKKVVPETQKEREKVFSYIGTIIELEKPKVVIQAEAFKNYLEKDTVLTALVTEKTEYFRLQIPKVLPKEIEAGKENSLFTREKISFSDLKIGDEVTVISRENIKGKTEFEVQRIEVVSLK